MISAAGFPLPERQKIGVSRRGLGGNHVPAAVIVLCDLLAVLIAGAASLVILKADGGGSLARTIEPQVVIPWVGLCAWLAACRLYGGHKPLPVEAACIAWGSLILALVTVLLLHHQERVGLVVLLPCVLAPLLLMLFRYVAKRLLYRSGAWSVPTVAIGPLRQCAGISQTLTKDWYRGFAVRALIPLDEANRAAVADRVATWAERDGVRHIHLGSDASGADAAAVRNVCRKYDLICETVTLRSELPLNFPVLDRLFGRDPLIREEPPSASAVRLDARLKRAIDVGVSATLLLFLLPVMLAIAYLVRRDGGPVIYPSARLGASGRQFNALKFRTMAADAEVRLAELLVKDPVAREEWATTFKLRNDPRITSIGKILRRSSLDELPQLFNVLRGDMSLVGPRPVLPSEREAYGHAFQLYCRCTPGITGPWQVSGRNNLDYERRIQLNSWYALHRTLLVDFGILLRTVLVVIRGEGAA